MDEQQRETQRQEFGPDMAGENPGESVVKRRKKHPVARGVLCGIVGTLAVGWFAVYMACSLTGTQVVIRSKGRSSELLLDADAVSKIQQIDAYIEAYYYDETDVDTLQDGLYKGMVDSLGDRYSSYYNEDDYAQMMVGTTGQYYGIGAGLHQENDTMVVTISKVYEGSPAEEAGLLLDDVIVSVDGTEGTSMEVTELVKLIRGEEGTSVHLEVYRPSTGEEFACDVQRRNITLPSVSHKLLQDNIGYIGIEGFERETAIQFEEALEDLKGQGMQSLIVDLRYNGGGLVDSVVQILDDILPEGLLVYVEDKAGNRQNYTSSQNSELGMPLAVLINEESASASEIFAGAVKDYGYGTLIGTKTFGKGIVQTIYKLGDGDAVKLTTAKYFTPKGNYIHGVGIEPDIELEYEYLNPDGEVYEEQYDNQLQKAISVLKGEE